MLAIATELLRMDLACVDDGKEPAAGIIATLTTMQSEG